MKERPILFNASMVRAILDGRKSQTRRIIKPQPQKCQHNDDEWIWSPHHTRLEALLRLIEKKCKHGQPGDRLWVRETWGIPYTYVDEPEVHKCDVMYRANPRDESSHITWRPSIRMPRCFSRITLEITAVRVERLQDISEEDAKAEGVSPEFEVDFATFIHNQKWNPAAASTYRLGYKHLCNEINGKDSWNKNPWVWVIEFKRVTA